MMRIYQYTQGKDQINGKTIKIIGTGDYIQSKTETATEIILKTADRDTVYKGAKRRCGVRCV